MSQPPMYIDNSLYGKTGANPWFVDPRPLILQTTSAGRMNAARMSRYFSKQDNYDSDDEL